MNLWAYGCEITSVDGLLRRILVRAPEQLGADS